jgi:hypothetical protein
MRGPLPDVGLALSWVPFALAGRLVEGNSLALQSLVTAVMFLSFAHQPLTLPFVYASPWRLATHRRLFLWCPLVALGVILLFSQINMVLVAVAGGLWNAEHTLMQRYGITRIYGRRAGDQLGPVEKTMLVGWFLVPLLWVAARGDLRHVVDQFGGQTVSGRAATMLARLSGEARIALPLVILAAGYVTVRWLAAQRGDRLPGGASPGKWIYLASTAGLFALAVIDPVAGLIGFVGSHSIEYFVIVNQSVASEARHEGTLGRVARMRHGRAAFFGLYLAAASGLFVALYWWAPPRILLVTVLTIGALHFFYDSFIWKLRKPAVAASLDATRAVGADGPRPLVNSAGG